MSLHLIPNSAYEEDAPRRPHAETRLTESRLVLNKNLSLEERKDRVYKAVMDKMRSKPSDSPQEIGTYDSYPQIEATFDSYAVVKKSGKLWAVPYEIDKMGTVTVGLPKEIVHQYAERKGSKNADNNLTEMA